VIRLRSPRDLLAGLFALALAAVAFWQLAGLRVGTLFRMGPAYFPLVLAAVVAVLGALLAGSAFVLDGPRLERWGWRAIAIVSAAILFFAVAIEGLGLFVTTAVLALAAAFAEPHNKLVSSLVFALAAAGFVVLVFPLALRVGIPIWPRL
jgi:putative tricarboxylic transport membrane protein